MLLFIQQSDGPLVVGCCAGGIVCSDSALIMSCAGRISNPKKRCLWWKKYRTRVPRSEFSVRVRVNPTVKKTATVARRMERFWIEVGLADARSKNVTRGFWNPDLTKFDQIISTAS
jgi:hypothetical protein